MNTQHRVMTEERGIRMVSTCENEVSILYTKYVIHPRNPFHSKEPYLPLVIYPHHSTQTRITTDITTMSTPEATGVRQRASPLEEQKNPYVPFYQSPRINPFLHTNANQTVIPSL
jgi:hypothetical protein